MDNQAKTKTKSRKPQVRPELEPIGYDEIMANAGMSGFVSFLDTGKPDAAGAELREWSAGPAGVHETATVPLSDTVQARPSVQQRKALSNTVQPTRSVEGSYTVSTSAERAPRRSRVKRARSVEDGHSLAEQEVYRTLWKTGALEGDGANGNRLVRIGYDRLANLVRLSWVTVKANLRSLEKKLSIEVVAAEDSANREGKQYRVYSTEAIWARRESAGLLWVRRSRGVELLTDEGGSVGQEPGAAS